MGASRRAAPLPPSANMTAVFSVVPQCISPSLPFHVPVHAIQITTTGGCICIRTTRDIPRNRGTSLGTRGGGGALYRHCEHVGEVHLGAVQKMFQNKKVWVSTEEWTATQGSNRASGGLPALCAGDSSSNLPGRNGGGDRCAMPEFEVRNMRLGAPCPFARAAVVPVAHAQGATPRRPPTPHAAKCPAPAPKVTRPPGGAVPKQGHRPGGIMSAPSTSRYCGLRPLHPQTQWAGHQPPPPCPRAEDSLLQRRHTYVPPEVPPGVLLQPRRRTPRSWRCSY